jgi:hypothetical protein
VTRHFITLTSVLVAIAAGNCIGCAQTPNPSFSVSSELADRDLQRMTTERKVLDRPLVVVSGFLDPGVAAWAIAARCRSITNDSRVIAVALGDCLTLDDCARRITAAVQHEFPSAKANETTEVDVIGYSLGGLASRYAAAPTCPTARRLRIARLFTISSPNQGADEAGRLPLLHPIQSDLRPGSAAIRRLNGMPSVYPICTYVRSGDRAIGVKNAGLPGKDAWWVPTPFMDDPHSGAFLDTRILADIARRLRGETPFASPPPAAVPKQALAAG